MAVVMSAGPQIVTATFFATSADAKRNSLAFLGGVATATTIGVTVFFLVGSGIAGKQKEGKDWLDWVIIGLLVFLLIWVFVRRNESQPPRGVSGAAGAEGPVWSTAGQTDIRGL
jgi:threonine/homoserine/homoserine lactone efflux protein